MNERVAKKEKNFAMIQVSIFPSIVCSAYKICREREINDGTLDTANRPNFAHYLATPCLTAVKLAVCSEHAWIHGYTPSAAQQQCLARCVRYT